MDRPSHSFHLLNQGDGIRHKLRFNAGRTGAYLQENRIAQRFSLDTCPSRDTCPIHALSTA